MQTLQKVKVNFPKGINLFPLISSLFLGDVTVSQSFADLAQAALLSFALIKTAVKLLWTRFCSHEGLYSPLQSLNPAVIKTSLCTVCVCVCVCVQHMKI